MNPLLDPRDISVIVQGPVDARYTPSCLKSIRKVLPGSTIILSTWEGSDTKGLDYDILVENKDPGSAMLDGKPSNHFRQIVSSVNGLKRSRTTYAIKMRSDMALKSKRFIDYFARYNDLPFDGAYKVVKKRFVAFTTHNPHRSIKQPFQMSDWFFFGRTEDLVTVFDIPLTETGAPLSAEQYIWLSCITKHQPISFADAVDPTPENITLSEKYFANNCILLSAWRAGVGSLKYAPNLGYTQTPALSPGFYTFTEYQQLLNKYAGAHLTIIPNPIEELTYAVMYHLRLFIKTTVKRVFPEMYSSLRKFINR